MTVITELPPSSTGLPSAAALAAAVVFVVVGLMTMMKATSMP